MPNLNLTRIDFKKKIADISLGEVYSYKQNLKKPQSQEYVVKVITIGNIEELLEYFNEIVFGFGFDHFNVLPIKGYHIEFDRKHNEGKLYLKLPKMRMTVKQVINAHKTNKRSIPEKKIVKYLYFIIQGLKYLHSKGIAHRNLKPENIFLDENNISKVANFELSYFVGNESLSELTESLGSIYYAAPENFKGVPIKKRNLFKGDVWSLGMLGLELCNLEVRFLNCLSSGEQKEKDIASRVSQMRGKYSDILLNLILSLLKNDPSERKDLQYVQKVLEDNYPYLTSRLPQGVEKRNIEVQTESENFGFIEAGKFQKLQEDLDRRFAEMIQIEENNKERMMNLYNEKLKEEPEAQQKVAAKSPKKIANEIKSRYKDVFKIKFREKEVSVQKSTDQIKAKTQEFMKELTSIDWKDYYKSLINFSMDLSGSYINNQSMKEIASNMCRNFKSLQHLSLNFSDCYKITGNGIKELASQISQSCSDLLQLRLDFKCCIQVDDIGITEIALQICTSLSNIQQLSLNFSECPITDIGVKELVFQISHNLQKLRKLSLYFQGCRLLTEKGIKEAICHLGPSLTSLGKIRLDLNGYLRKISKFKIL